MIYNAFYVFDMDLHHMLPYITKRGVEKHAFHSFFHFWTQEGDKHNYYEMKNYNNSLMCKN